MFTRAVVVAVARRALHATAVRRATLPITLPSMSPTMTAGNIVKWHKKEGEKVVPGDVLLEIETDKATIDVETQETGTFAKALMPEGSKGIQVGTLIGLMVEEGDDWRAAKAPTSTAAPTPATPNAPQAVQPTSAAAQPVASTAVPTSQPLSPAVLVLVAANHLDVSKIPATGPHGRLLKGDVLSYIEGQQSGAGSTATTPTVATSSPSSPASSPTPAPPAATKPKSTEVASAYNDVPVSQMRKVIASRLTESKFKIPHVYTSISVDMTHVTLWRKNVTLASGDKNFKAPSVNTIITKAVAMALRRNPQMNINIVNDNAVTQPNVDVSFAVAMEGGLITPIVRAADTIPLAKLGEQIDQLATRARAGKLKPEEYQGGTFSISNLGMFGIKEFTAVINPPQVGILAVSSTLPQVILPEDALGTAVASKPAVVPMMNVTLSSDARFVSQETVAQFLADFVLFMEVPRVL